MYDDIVMTKRKHSLVVEIIAYFCFLITFSSYIFCNRPTFDSSIVRTQLYGKIGMPLALSANEFFNEYKIYLGGQRDYFKYTTLFNFGIKFIFSDWYRIVANIDYFISEFTDSYIQDVKETYGAGKRDITQDIKITSLPFIIGIELYPISQQFRTFVSGGLGACFGNINWNESFRTTIENDLRKGGTHFSSNSIFPTIRFGTGIELGFDDKYDRNILSSLLLEVNYTFIFRYVEIFKEVSEQFQKAPQNWDKLYPILPSYLSLSLGISINLYRL